MFTAYLVVTLLAVAANTFSGVAAIAHFKPIIPGMVKAGVPESWLTFPIGTLKAAGAVGLLLGLIGVPRIGTAAAIGELDQPPGELLQLAVVSHTSVAGAAEACRHGAGRPLDHAEDSLPPKWMKWDDGLKLL